MIKILVHADNIYMHRPSDNSGKNTILMPYNTLKMNWTGAGSFQGALISYRNNLQMLRKTAFNRQRNPFKYRKFYDQARARGEISSTGASKEELKRIRTAIIRLQKTNSIIRLSALICCLAFVAAVSLYLHNRMAGQSESQTTITRQQLEQLKKDEDARFDQDRFNFNMQTASKHIEHKRWVKAKLHLETALEIFPHDKEARYNYTFVQLTICLKHQQLCSEASESIHYLLKIFPEDETLKSWLDLLSDHAELAG